ncbi:M20/M25/M40 family metallo-hydrolase [Bradyrhizobium ivorense]|uniref:M20/M25/M40 family metallo-hydrolase n=1 Tax=Bradyrhizobium ivorense TaxID=2511166 RepID=UPI003556E7BD
MDALPLNEGTALPFRSRIAGAMHACGHNTHVAMLVAPAKALCARRETLSGTVLFMFQPGEEGFLGARCMIEDGLLDPLRDAAFASRRPMRPRAALPAAQAGCSRRPTGSRSF